MNLLAVDEVLEVFAAPQSFYYFKDKFVIDHLLAYRNEYFDSRVLRDLGLDSCVSNPTIRKLMAESNGRLNRQRLLSFWPSETLAFSLTFSKWGSVPLKYQKDSWYQTSRSGYSLVIQLNFGSEHNNSFYRWLRPEQGGKTFQYSGHPIAECKFLTLAWSRIDIEFGTGEVLIEELQTDWIRRFDLANTYFENDLQKDPGCTTFSKWGITCQAELWEKYQSMMRMYKTLWAEAMLHATVEFIKHEIGISKIWMHSFESGNLFKDLNFCPPPRSLYTKLPRKYGFSLSTDMPEFLVREKYLKRYFKKARQKDVQWYKLNHTA